MAKSGKKSFKDSYSQYNELLASMQKGKYVNIYLLMGEEGYFIDMLSNYISVNAMPEDMKPFNQTVLYGGSSSAQEVVSLCRQYPMTGEKSVIILRDAQAMSDLASLLHYIKEPLPTTLLVLCHSGKMLDKRSPLYKAINKESGAVVFESVPPREYEVDGWINDLVKNHGRTIEPSSIQMLVQYLGADIIKISNELDKLLTALPENVKKISSTDIENYIGISKDFNNFELTKSLSECNFYKALLIARYFAESQKQNPYVVTIQMLYMHFQRIFNLAIIMWTAKHKKTQIPSDMELAKILSLPSPFFLKEYMQAVKHYNTSRSYAILGLIREYDLKGKGLNQGGVTVGELLEELILKISKQ
ncbi:MAG: DNA polymerase III subunit delta [Bacteroidetes bacterium]|nr:DNA polymerase III subunit delta [Bacteroidota bacterium]